MFVIHDHNVPVSVFGCNPNAGSNHAPVVDAAVTYDEPKIGQVFIILSDQAIEMKGHNHHLLCPMQYHMNHVMIDEVPVLSEPCMPCR